MTGTTAGEALRGDAALRLLLDRTAADGWPPVERVDVAGWRLRAASGVTRRANSALPSGGVPTALDARLDAVRAFYGERDLPVLLQVSDPDLDEALDRRGWGRHTPTLVMTGPLPAAQPRPVTEVPDGSLELSSTAGPEWLECWWAVDGRGGERELEVAQACLAAITSRTCFVALRQAGQVVAVGRSVAQQGWLGIYAMAVLPEHRSRGLGRSVLEALTSWGAATGADAVFLQVAQDNSRAQEVYAAAGLVPSYGYSYRTPPLQEVPLT